VRKRRRTAPRAEGVIGIRTESPISGKRGGTNKLESIRRKNLFGERKDEAASKLLSPHAKQKATQKKKEKKKKQKNHPQGHTTRRRGEDCERAARFPFTVRGRYHRSNTPSAVSLPSGWRRAECRVARIRVFGDLLRSDGRSKAVRAQSGRGLLRKGS